MLVVVSGFQAFGVDAHHHKAGVFTKILVFLAFVSAVSPNASTSAYAIVSNRSSSSRLPRHTRSLRPRATPLVQLYVSRAVLVSPGADTPPAGPHLGALRHLHPPDDRALGICSLVCARILHPQLVCPGQERLVGISVSCV